MKKKIYVAKNLQEETTHGDFTFPFYVSEDSLYDYDQNSIACHWHSELELTVVTKGRMEYHINDRSFLLTAGTGILTNSNALHFAYPVNEENCWYQTIIFDPRFIYGYEGSVIERKYIDSIVRDTHLDAVPLDSAIAWQQEILDIAGDITGLSKEKPLGYELFVKSSMCRLWALLYLNLSSRKQGVAPRSISTLKEILSFIHENYTAKITLQDIADSGGISKGECCRLFKKTLKQPPIGYLQFYRIHRSIPLLMRGDTNITEISELVGFNGASYYAETFKKIMRCAPREYRRLSQEAQAE